MKIFVGLKKIGSFFFKSEISLVNILVLVLVSLEYFFTY